jgi:hypothetical protein
LPGYALNPCASAVLNNFGVYKPFSTSHFTADRTHDLLANLSDADVPGRAGLLALMSAYSAYSIALLGEGMCSAIVDNSAELTRVQIAALAETKFTQAITEAQSAGADSTRYMALIGRARARINQGNKAGAATDARLIPVGYVKYAKYTADPYRAANLIFYHANR